MNFSFFNKEFVSSFFLVNLMGGGGGQRVAPCRYLLSHTYTSKPDRKNKNTDKEKWENIRTHVAACIYLFNQTYSPKPDTTQRNSKECCIWNGSHVHARKLRPQQSAKIKQMQMIFAVKKQAHKVTKGLRTFFKCFHEKKKDKQIFTYHERSRSHTTNTISTWNFLMVESGKKNIFQSYFLETWRSQWILWGYWYLLPNKGAKFPVIRGLEKPKLLHTRTWTWQYNNRQSNYRLMNVLFCTRALFPDFSKSSKQ